MLRFSKTDEQLKRVHEEEDERLARVLLDIANEVVPGITMEADAVPPDNVPQGKHVQIKEKWT